MVAILQEIHWPSSWDEAQAFARRLTDGLGCPLDEGIVDTVVALNLLGFPTEQSCEGHLDGGHPYPWIDFRTGECPAWYEQAQEECCREGLSEDEEEAATHHLMDLVAAYHHENHLYTRLSALLETFSTSRTNGPEDWSIVLHILQPGSYRLLPSNGYAADEWPADARATHLARAQSEMQAFTEFLKQQWTQKDKEIPEASTRPFFLVGSGTGLISEA